MLHLDPRDPLARYFVYSVAASSLAMVWQLLPVKFRFARPRDVGISVYLAIVTTFFYLLLPLEIIKPVFFADPLGALVGRYLTEHGWPNPRWAGQKTVGGSGAVLVASLASISYGNPAARCLLAATIALAEGVTSEFDNLFIAAIVIAGYVVLG